MTGQRRRPGRWVDVAGWALVPVLAGIGVVRGSPLVAVTAPLVVVLVVVDVRRRRRWRADLARAEALPAVVDHLIQRLRAGSSLAQACRSLSADGHPGRPRGRAPTSTATAVRPLTDALDRGLTLADASRCLRADADPSLRLLGTTVRLLAVNGGPAVPALRRLRHTLVGRAHRRRRAQAQAASALSSAGLLVLAPGSFALILAGTEPALARFYLREPLGAACASASVLLSGLGWWWIHHLVGRFRLADG